MHHREMTTITRGVKGGSRPRDVLANNRGITNLAITETELIMREADRARIVSALGLFEGARQKGDAAGWFAPGDRHSTVHSPKVRQTSRIEPLTLVWRTTQRLRSLPKVVLEEPRLRESATNLDLVVSTERRIFESPNEKGSRLWAASLFQGLQSLAVKRSHGAQYTWYTRHVNSRDANGVTNCGPPSRLLYGGTAHAAITSVSCRTCRSESYRSA